ncbi:MAG: Hsp70 family protein [Myxococcaceae bacterium]
MSRYAIGIDLGTTHSALSYFNLEEGTPRGGAQAMLPIAQLTAPGTMEERQLLPSFLYLPSPQEFPDGSLVLPWDKSPGEILGEFARSHGAKVPSRLVSSAKSWLSHPAVDRRQALLPWQAPEEVPRLSPVDISAKYLRHIKEAWNSKFAADRNEPGWRLEEQDVIVTVPASFDAAARELTLEAAAKAGLTNVTLVEEPQAALYAWLEASGEGYRKQVKPGDVILVVDLGGGTTDLSLISVVDREGNVELHRLAVGDHILLGGDNMDLTLAHALNQKLAASGKKLDTWQFNGLVHGSRMAKEQLFADPSLDKLTVAVPGRGSSLIGGTIKTELLREELNTLLIEGFFPHTPPNEAPRTARRTGLAQMALPYAQDPAVSRHLAYFLTRQLRSLEQSTEPLPVKIEGRAFLHPTAVLFNGGVFKAAPLKARLMEVVNAWLAADGGEPARELAGADLDLAVARGGAYYGWVRKGHGVRIRGGTARAYYVGVESAMPAVPGMEPPVKALCVAPFGMEEGTHADVPPQEFGLVVGEPTQFRFFSSSVRREDKVGDFIDDVEGNPEFEEVAPIETTLPAEKGREGKLVPVNLQAAVTEVGSLELRCLEKGGPGKWKLELNVRMRE